MSFINKMIESIDITVRAVLTIVSGTVAYIIAAAVLFGTLIFIVPHTGFIIGSIIALTGIYVTGWAMIKFWDFLIECPAMPTFN